MDLKKKFEAAKAKLKQHAPEAIIFGTAAVTLVYCIISVKKQIEAGGQEVFLIPSSGSSDQKECMIMTTVEAREKIASDDSFELNHVESDLYYLSLTSDEE